MNTQDHARTAHEVISAVSTGLLIDGAWGESATGARFEVINPATEEVIATVADGGPDDARRAIEAAGRAQPEWARTAPRERSEPERLETTRANAEIRNQP